MVASSLNKLRIAESAQIIELILFYGLFTSAKIISLVLLTNEIRISKSKLFLWKKKVINGNKDIKISRTYL